MNKMIKKILLIVITMFLLAGNVYATETTLPEGFNGFYLDKSDSKYQHGEIKGLLPEVDEDLGQHQGGRTYFKISTAKTDNRLLYCSDGNKHTDGVTIIADFSTNCKVYGKNQKSLAYVFENAYGSYKEVGEYNSKYLTNENIYTDYYITQAAVWNFTAYHQWFGEGFDFTGNGTFYGHNNDIVTKITKLIQDAETAQKEGASLSVTTTDSSMSLTPDAKYYISKGMQLNGKYLSGNITARVSGVEGAFVTSNADATSGQTTFTSGTTVYIKVPEDKITSATTTITLEISANTAIENSQVIECGYTDSPDDAINDSNINNVQPMVIYYQNMTELTATTNVTTNKYPVKISKKDNNGTMLEGATLVVKMGATVVETWNTEIQSKTLLLAPGTYTLEETKVPTGYVAENKNITFTVNNQGKIHINNKETSEIVLTNKPIIITISKRTVKDDNELPGATLRIIDKNGNLAKDINGNNLEWTSSDKQRSFHVSPGTYILEETKAPEGYELSDKQIEFTVNNDGTVTIEEGLLIKKEKVVKNNLIIFENTPEPVPVPTGSIIFYTAITLGVIALGITTYIIIKKTKK